MAVLYSDTWTGANGAAWNAAWVAGLNGSGAIIDIQNNVGRLKIGTATGGYNGANKVGRRLQTQYGTTYALFRFNIDAIEQYSQYWMRGDAQLDGVSGYEVRFLTGTTLTLSRVTNYSSTSLGTASVTKNAGTWYWMRASAVGSTFKVKVWADGSAEPTTGGVDGAGNQISATDTTYTTGYNGFVNSPGGAGGSAGAGTLLLDDFTLTDSLGNAAPTVGAGTNQTNIEPGTLVTLTGTATDSDGTISSTSWTQTGGSPTVTLSGTGLTRTFYAPGNSGGTTLTFQFSATDNGGATSTATVTVGVLTSTEFIARSGAWVGISVIRL